MNNKFFIITVFISNITFGAVSPKIELHKVVNMQNTDKLSTKISTQLFNNGLDKHIAKVKVQNSLVHNQGLNDLIAHNILKTLKTLSEKDIIDFLTQSVLRGKKVDLSAYSTLVALVQKSSQRALDKKTLLQVKKVSLENRALKAMWDVI